MKRLAAVLVAGALIIGLAGCSGSRFDEETQTYEDGSGPGSETGPYDDDLAEQDLYIRTKTFPDGRVLTCIVFAEYQKGGLDCNWAEFNDKKESE